MKSDIRSLLPACLCLVMAMASPASAQKTGCEVAVAALTLPDGSDGMLHWIAADASTTPLQLSTRYFSDRVKVLGEAIHFYGEPQRLDPAAAKPPKPLVSVKLPPDLKLAYIVLWTAGSDDGGSEWKATLFNGMEWKEGSLKVLNASGGTLGIIAGEKRLQVSSGKSVDFLARDFKDSFPVKIYLREPEPKLVFSSTWRITPGHRELCFLSGAGNSISPRSLIDLAAMPLPARQ